MITDTPMSLHNRRAPRQYPWLDRSVRADVCVIGGGVTGVLCALRLAQEGRSVVLLSRRPLGYGISSRIMPCSMCDCGRELRGLSRSMGRENALRLMDMTAGAADRLEELCAVLHGSVGFARRDSLIYAADDAEASRLYREKNEYRRSGLECLGMDSAAFGSAFGFPAAGALLICGGAVELDAYMLIHHAAERAADMGAMIFENTSAARIAAEKNGRVTVHTSTHTRVDAGGVVVAAGMASAELLEGTGRAPARYVAAGRVLHSFRGWPGRCVIRSAGEPGLICCTSPDGRAYISSRASLQARRAERLRTLLHLPSAAEKRYRDLEDAARYMFPDTGITAMECGWTLSGLRTADGLPIAGTVPGHPGCVFAVSGGEGGVLLSELLSRMVTDLLCGRGSGDMEMFSPSRRRLAG